MYQTTDPTPWPPTRSDTSVPGTTNQRGKLPAMTGPPGPPGGAPGGGTWASWSMRRCKSSWLARRSPNSSALALGNAVINATAAVNPPSAATVPIFRLLIIGPPKTGRTFLSTYDIARVAAIQARVVRLV